MNLLKKIFVPLLWVVVIAAVTQYVFIAFVPRIIFAIAKHRSGLPLNTMIHAPKTDAGLRRVVLPNPDFVYSAYFYDLSKGPLTIIGQFPPSTQYASLAFYGSNILPYHVLNNIEGKSGNYEWTLMHAPESTRQVPPVISSKGKQGVILMRILVTDSASRAEALRLRDMFKVETP